MHNEYQIEYKNTLPIFRNALAVLVENDEGVYIPYERESWGQTFDDYILNTLIASINNATLRAEIREYVNPETISNIDLVLAWVGENCVHNLYCFSSQENDVVTIILQDEHMVDCIDLVECGGDTVSLIPLSNSLVTISNSDSTAN